MFNISFLPKYRVKYYDYMVKWCSGIYIGVNVSERKSGTERSKKRKKRELVFSPPPPGGATDAPVHRLDATRILPELRLPEI